MSESNSVSEGHYNDTKTAQAIDAKNQSKYNPQKKDDNMQVEYLDDAADTSMNNEEKKPEVKKDPDDVDDYYFLKIIGVILIALVILYFIYSKFYSSDDVGDMGEFESVVDE